MKRLILLFAFLCTLNLFAQKDYSVNGETYSLNTEVEGTLTLLWNIVDGEYRYFAMKGSDIQELINSKGADGYQEEYKATLATQTSDHPIPVDQVKLTLSSLRGFFNDYNKTADPTFDAGQESVALKARLGIFAGMSNYVYFPNPQNSFLPQAGLDLEIIDEVKLKRHSLVLQFRQLFANSEHDVSNTQLSLNYRFKFIKTQRIDVFVNTKIAAYTYQKSDIPDPNGDGDPEDAFSGSGSEFQAPFGLGLGADIALGNGFLTFAYNDMFALNLENSSDDFSVDFTLGYKFNL